MDAIHTKLVDVDRISRKGEIETKEESQNVSSGELNMEKRTSELGDDTFLEEDDDFEELQMGSVVDDNELKSVVSLSQPNPPGNIKTSGTAARNDNKRVRINQPRDSVSSVNSVIIRRDPIVESIIESRKLTVIDNSYTRLASSTRPPHRTNPFDIRPRTTDTENELKDRAVSSRVEKKVVVPTTIEYAGDDGWDEGLTEELEKDKITAADKTCAQLYDETCKRLNICPSTIILRSLHTTKINLGNYGLGARGCSALAVGLLRNITVLSLNLSGNNIGTNGMIQVYQIMTENAYIEEYDLSFNNIGTKGNEKLVSAVANCSQLKSLNVAGNKLTSNDLVELLSTLEDHSYLKNLNISHNELDEEGGIYLANWLGENHVLVNFDASWCSIRLAGAKAVARAIGENNRLATLDLSHNSFTNSTLQSITNSLASNSALAELNLRGSHFISRYEGPVKEDPDILVSGKESQIYDMLVAAATNQSLKIFRLGENHIDERCLMVILESLAEVEDITLEELDLTGLMTNENLITKGHALFANHPKLHVYVGPVKQTVESFANNLLSSINKYSQENEVNLSEIFYPNEDLTATITTITYEQFLEGLRKGKIPFPTALINDIMRYLGKDSEQGTIPLRSLQTS